MGMRKQALIRYIKLIAFGIVQGIVFALIILNKGG